MKLIVISLLLVNFAVYIQTRSVSNLGDIHIDQSEDKWICDMIECPLNSARCYVSKSNEENPSVLKRVNICYSENNEILAQKNTSSATDPNNQVLEYVNSNRNGGISVSGTNKINFNEKEFNEQMERDMNDLHRDIENMQKDIQRDIEEQQRQLQESLRQMQNDLAHMFD